MSDVSGNTVDPAAGRRSLGPVPRWVLVALVWLIVLALALATDQVTRAAYQHGPGRIAALNLPAEFLTELLKLRSVALCGVLLLLADRRLRWRFALDFSVVTLVQAGAASLLKDVFNRLRPDDVEAAGHFLGPQWHGPGSSFPSGHATAAWALAALLTAYYPRWRWVFFSAATAVCWARLHLDRHYPADLLAGALLGWYLSMALLAGIARIRRRRAPQTTAPAADA